MESEIFKYWAKQMKKSPDHLHRKIWEWCYITQALYERNKLEAGSNGLGFGVGQEPLTDLFASKGCNITATDLETQEASEKGWEKTGEHAGSLENLNALHICDEELFLQRVKFQFLDMRSLPEDLGTFDFIWSSCSLEHLGSIALGEKFIYDSLKYLRPGGISIHTLEFNTSSNDNTIAKGDTVLFRKKDIERIATHLKHYGYGINLDFTAGDLPADRYTDLPPYKQEVHLKLLHGKYIITSFGLIIEKPVTMS